MSSRDALLQEIGRKQKCIPGQAFSAQTDEMANSLHIEDRYVREHLGDFAKKAWISS